MITFGPRHPMPLRVTYGGASLIRQYQAVEQWAKEHEELDQREDECLRMFGVRVDYTMDERIIHRG